MIDYSEEMIIREPVFTFDHAKKVWGESYWALDGYRMLQYARRLGYRNPDPTLKGLWDYRPNFGSLATRNVCYIRPVELGEVPNEIIRTYAIEDIELPDNLTLEELELYILQKSWAMLFIKWDSLSLKPERFNTLLYKFILIADHSKQGIVILDTKDLYVNVNPYDYQSKFDNPYPVEDLQGQIDAYDQWLTFAGFNRYYITGDKGLVATPWYYRIPRINAENDVVGIQEVPQYKLHPIETTQGIFYPIGYDRESD